MNRMQRRAAKFGSPFGRPAQPTSSEQPSVGTPSNTPELNLEEIVPASSETSKTSSDASPEGTKENPKLWEPPFTISNVSCCGFMDVSGIHGVIALPGNKVFARRDYNSNGNTEWYRFPTMDECFQMLHKTIKRHGNTLDEASNAYNRASDEYYKDSNENTRQRMEGAQRTYLEACRRRIRLTGAYLFTYTIHPDVFQKELDAFLAETKIGTATHAAGFRNGNSGRTVYTTVVGLDTGSYTQWARERQLNTDIIR